MKGISRDQALVSIEDLWRALPKVPPDIRRLAIALESGEDLYQSERTETAIALNLLSQRILQLENLMEKASKLCEKAAALAERYALLVMTENK